MKLTIALALTTSLAAAAAAERSAGLEATLPARGSQQDAPPKPDLYDESADGAADVAAAVAKAQRENKRVLVQWGADWCGWCHWLNGACTKDKALAKALRYEYEVVHVDIGKWDKHLDLAERLGARFKDSGVPYLTILDGKGRAVVNTASDVFECPDDGNGLRHDPAKLAAFLAIYEAPRQEAAALVSAAVEEAKGADKRVLLTFGAPWCGWCHRFEDWAHSPAVAPVLAKDFVLCKVDTERTIGGQELLVRTRGELETGIPWWAILGGDGAVVASSTTKSGGNLGCPWTPEEKTAFDAILAAHAPRISAEERAAVLARLGDDAKKD